MREFSALVAIGRVNLALCQQWVAISLHAMERAHRLHVASLEALWGRPIAATEAAFELGSKAMQQRAAPVDLVRRWVRTSDLYGTLSQGLSQFVAEYAADMDDRGPPPFSPDPHADAIGHTGREGPRDGS